ncbi:BolA family protein [Caldimonas sp. KR1-144]|uniref:BolA family protein n=1 Tax=Caldimonas sp. KR1-144 TaxID=3400911 RepID=UPI003BFEF208
MSDPVVPLHERPTPAAIEAALRAALPVLAIDVVDDSASHAGHAGARAGGHYKVRLVSQRFDGLARIARHRLVYDALAPWMHRGIHALALQTLTPAEAAA